LGNLLASRRKQLQEDLNKLYSNKKKLLKDQVEYFQSKRNTAVAIMDLAQKQISQYESLRKDNPGEAENHLKSLVAFRSVLGDLKALPSGKQKYTPKTNSRMEFLISKDDMNEIKHKTLELGEIQEGNGQGSACTADEAGLKNYVFHFNPNDPKYEFPGVFTIKSYYPGGKEKKIGGDFIEIKLVSRPNDSTKSEGNVGSKRKFEDEESVVSQNTSSALQTNDDALVSKITDNHDGTYFVQYRVQREIVGESYLFILLNNEHIKNSPFRVKFHREKNKLISGMSNHIVEDGQKAIASHDGAWCQVGSPLQFGKQVHLHVVPAKVGALFVKIRIYNVLAPEAYYQDSAGQSHHGKLCWNLCTGDFYHNESFLLNHNHRQYNSSGPQDQPFKLSFTFISTGIECFYNNNYCYTFKEKINLDLPYYVFIDNFRQGTSVELLKQ
jgi:hypothetical protein